MWGCRGSLSQAVGSETWGVCHVPRCGRGRLPPFIIIIKYKLAGVGAGASALLASCPAEKQAPLKVLRMCGWLGGPESCPITHPGVSPAPSLGHAQDTQLPMGGLPGHGVAGGGASGPAGGQGGPRGKAKSGLTGLVSLGASGPAADKWQEDGARLHLLAPHAPLWALCPQLAARETYWAPEEPPAGPF